MSCLRHHNGAAATGGVQLLEKLVQQYAGPQHLGIGSLGPLAADQQERTAPFQADASVS